MACCYIGLEKGEGKSSFFRRLVKSIKKVEFKSVNSQYSNMKVNFKLDKLEKMNERKSTNLSKAIYNELYNNNVFNVAIDEDIANKTYLRNLLYSQNINVLDGNKLLAVLNYEILKEISQRLKISIKNLEISFLVNMYNSLNSYNIKKVAKDAKVVNIVTEKIDNFKVLTDSIYEETGTYIQVSKPNKNILKKSNIIINIDYNEEEINKCIFPKESIIINIGKNLKIKTKQFSGIIINDVDIYIPNKYKNLCDNEFKTKSSILCESILYNNLDEIDKTLDLFKAGGFKIDKFKGEKGIIQNQEFLRVRKSNNILDKKSKVF